MFFLSISIVNAQWLPTVTSGIFPWCNPIKLITVGNKFIEASQACNVIMSSDSGETWTPIHNGIPLSKFPRDIVLKDSIIFLTVTDTTSSIYSSSNLGNNWTLMNNGFPTQIYINKLAVLGNNIFAGTSEGMYLSNDNGNLWTQVNNGIPTNTTILSITTSGNNIYVGTYGKGIFYSNNYGNSWNNINSGLTINLSVTAINITANNIFISAYDTVSFSKYLYLSINNGNSWAIANNGMPINTAIKSFISYGTNIFAGGSDTSGTNVYLTTNNGGLWTDVGNGFEVGGFYLSTISNFVIYGDYIYANVDSVYPYRRLLSQMVGIEENFQKKIVSIYPNPSTGLFTVKQTSDIKNIEVCNILGEKVYYVTLNNNIEAKINLSNIPKGIYFVKLDNGVLIHTEKIIIN